VADVRRGDRRLARAVRVPLVPMSHQYVVTEPFLARSESPLPTLRDPDLLSISARRWTACYGWLERNPGEPFTATAGTFDRVPADFQRQTPPETGPGWRDRGQRGQRVPQMADLGVRTVIKTARGRFTDNGSA